MADRATVANVIQIGAESTSTPGTEVDAGKLVASLEITGGIKSENTMFRPSGWKYGSFVIPGREWSEWKLGGQATYGELVYLLASILKSTTPVSDTSTGKKWTFTPALSAEDTVQTYTVEMGSSVRAHQFLYGMVSELGLKFTRDRVEIDGTMIGQRITDGITLTSTPAAIESTPKPILGSQVSVLVADSWAGLASGTTLTRVLSAEWRVANRHGPLWVLNAANTSFVAQIELPPKVTLKLMMEADATGMGYLTLMRAATKKWVEIQAVGETIESGKTYLLQLDGCFNVSEPAEFSDQDGVYAIEWTLEAVYDSTATKTIEAIVRNILSAL
jgi:hypothetical protein